MAVLLVLVTIALYWPATQCDFVNYDDPAYVTENPHVQAGFNWEGVKWGFLNPVHGNWHPLTVWSHMLDCQMFGLKPWGHHLTSVLLHALNAMLVFALFQQMTGARWRSLCVAALFAAHPLRVESVAWVAEHKDMLSVCFGLLALILYIRYAQGRRKNAEGRMQNAEGGIHNHKSPITDHAFICYLLSLCCFALALMSKAMLVTWPFVMLLLDCWPLQRNVKCAMRNAEAGAGGTVPDQTWPWVKLVWEKIPFFALAAAASVVTVIVQKHAGAMGMVQSLPLGVRSGNALISYCRYLGKLFWPTNLAVFYPHPVHWPLGQVMLAGGLLLGISGLLFVTRRRFPFLLMGWLWFVGTLVPVIGLVQVGKQAMADRYTHAPSLGVLVLAVWGACELTRRWRHPLLALWVVGSAAILLCFALTRQQLAHWKDSEALFRHALEVTENNFVAHNNLAIALVRKGQLDAGVSQYREALRLEPGNADAHYNLGVAFGRKGELDAAISQFHETLRLQPENANAHNNLGTALGMQGKTDEAISQYREALRLRPGSADAKNNLAKLLKLKGESNAGTSHPVKP
jgi:protein O-mannosyl-transferase